MSKIDEFERKIIKQGMTDEDFAEYQKLLKRVRGNFLKRQHCYTTAIQFPTKYADQAIKLIRYGLENFEIYNDGFIVVKAGSTGPASVNAQIEFISEFLNND